MPSVHGLFSLLAGAREDLAAGRKVQVAGVSETLAELMVLALGGRVIVVVPTAKDVPPWSAFLEASQALTLNASGVLPFYAGYGNDRFINPGAARRQRLYALALLASPPATGSVIVTTLQALGQRTLAPSTFRAAILSLRVGAEIDQEYLLRRLDDLGYVPAPSVVEEGQFALRGGILDVFPPSADDPVRLEFIGDSVASLRSFSAADQKSKKSVPEIAVGPAYEALTPQATRKDDAQRLFNALLEQNTVPADRDGMLAQFQQGVHFAGFDMLAPLFRPEAAPALAYAGDATLVFPLGIEPCLESYRDLHETLEANLKKDVERARPALPVTLHFETPDALAAKLSACRHVVEFGNPYAAASASLYRIEARLVADGAPLASHGAALFDKWIEVIDRTLVKDGGAVAVFALHDEQIERLMNLLTHRGLNPVLDPGLLASVVRGDVPNGTVRVGKGAFASHAWLPERALLILPEQALFGARPRPPKAASQKLQNYLSSFADLKVSDLVVHVQHGIGRYKGLTSLTVGGLASDFLVIEYSGGDKIYLPVDRLSLLQRYSAGEGQTAAVDKLGGVAWEKRKSKVKGAVRDMADQLLKLHARRALAKGQAFGAPDDAYVQFEAEFPYEETEDQVRAIHDVDADLASGRPMDRLVCGDVGFGKTEVAMRAVMRAVLEGTQALVLVPTTVLCYQHYRTFKDRLEQHGVRVARVDRFVRGVDAKAALDGLKAGTVDVLIGTHRMLSKDVIPKRLGLLVVDEEQRFGVSHKEALKELRAGAHVLTLTATPIPRTLHMAMVGLRDISIIATPPQDRLAVKTYIARFDEALIKDAIEQEVRRGGQVFFVHNRVEDIEELRLFLKTLVPHAEVRVGHGQMREHQLEQVIVDFLDQKFQVLLCTTIIESGVDMPNVNTLIVDRADRFGLAQLYQLRGRVGRSSLQAYAYFLTPAPISRTGLSEDAQKRLDVLAAHQELGAGFQIASHDLELRGAGNLLGGEQSGFAAAVGLEMYTDMLDAAIHELRGEPVEERIDTEIKLPLSASIPATFVPAETQRLHLYKSLFGADTEDDLRALRHDVQDRFGALPAEAALLFKVARLKQQLRRLGALRLTAGKGVFELRCKQLPDDRIDRIMKAIKRQPDHYKLAPDGRLLLYMRFPEKPTLPEQDDLLGRLSGMLEPLLGDA